MIFVVSFLPKLLILVDNSFLIADASMGKCYDFSGRQLCLLLGSLRLGSCSCPYLHSFPTMHKDNYGTGVAATVTTGINRCKAKLCTAIELKLKRGEVYVRVCSTSKFQK